MKKTRQQLKGGMGFNGSFFVYLVGKMAQTCLYTVIGNDPFQFYKYY